MKATEIDDKNFLGYSCLGKAYKDLQQYDLALENINKGLELNNKDEGLFYQKGEIELIKENYDSAIECFNSALEISTSNVYTYEKLALCHLKKDDGQKALGYMYKAFEYSTKNPEIYIEFAKIMTEKKDYLKGLNKLKNYEDIDPLNADCLNLQFYINFLLAKEENSHYNKEKAIEIAKKIRENNLDFKYTEELEILNQK